MESVDDMSAGGFAVERAVSSKSIASMPPMYDEAEFYPDEERKIRKNANMNIEVEGDEYKQSIQEIKNIIERNNGFFTNENEYKSFYNKKEYRTYSITLKVPVENFDAAAEQLKLIGDVKNYNSYSNDMTTQYMDTKAYLESYEKEKAKIEQLLDRAEKIEDIIKIEDKLNQLQRTIDSYQRQLKNIDRVTDYSQISVSIQEKRPVSEAIYTMTGLKQLLRNVISSFDTLFVFISSIIGWVIGLLIVYGVYKGFKRLRN
tara:strand:- start:234 stop:1010 length:777 start_codon:yes stop_codon:yes gene_type:complete